jgi:hypothetical protein
MSTRERSWPVPAALAALSAIPLTAGTLRLTQLAGGPAVIPADHRFASFPLPLVVHIVGATAYALAGILQFVPRFRARHLAWHRRAGRVLAVAGLLVAISALWMTLFYRRDLAKGAGWVINLAVAEWAIRRPAVRRTSRHPRSTPAGAPS